MANGFNSLEEPSINLTIRDQPIFEDEDQAKQAMDEMANQLRLVSVLGRCLFRTLLTFRLFSEPSKAG
jgi:hypothetical protein